MYYINKLSLQDELLFCHPLPAEDIFKVLNGFILEGPTDWGHCCEIYIDEAKALTGGGGCTLRFLEALYHSFKKMPKELCVVLDQAVKIMNLIKCYTCYERPSFLRPLQ